MALCAYGYAARVGLPIYRFPRTHSCVRARARAHTHTHTHTYQVYSFLARHTPFVDDQQALRCENCVIPTSLERFLYLLFLGEDRITKRRKLLLHLPWIHLDAVISDKVLPYTGIGEIQNRTDWRLASCACVCACAVPRALPLFQGPWDLLCCSRKRWDLAKAL